MTPIHQAVLRLMEPDVIAVAAVVLAAKSGHDSHGVSLDSRLRQEIKHLHARLEKLTKLAEQLQE